MMAWHGLSRHRPEAVQTSRMMASSLHEAALDGVRRQGPTRSVPVDEIGRLFGIGFALDQLRRDLDDLLERANELTAGGRGQDVEG